jgi:hypothetical protein
MAEAQGDLDPGDETRNTGDRLGFPHPVSGGTALDDVSNLDPGVPVTYDGTDIAESTSASDDIVGILYTLPVYGESTRGPYVRGDKDATVAVRGSYVADLTDFSTPTVGTYLDDNSNVYVFAEVDSSNNYYEVIVG